MSSLLRRSFLPALLALGSATLIVACAQLQEASDLAPGSAGTGDQTGASTGGGAGGQDASIVITPDASPDGFNPAKPFAHLCDEGACVPGADPSSCSRGGGGEGGSGGIGGGGDPTSCKLVPGEMGAEAVCMAPGANAAQQVCQTAADCADGLGCGATNLCMHYCCGLAEDCPTQTYCAQAAIAEEPDAEPSVPLCVPVKDCALLDDDCADNETCSIVREDGTTSCIPAGVGESCDPCPCAQGYICSKGPNVCLKLCHTNRTDECGTGFCQGGASNYPSDIGVCVGGDADDCAP